MIPVLVILIVVSILAGWARNLFSGPWRHELRALECLAVAFVVGILARVAVLRFRLQAVAPTRGPIVLRVLTTDLLVSIAVGLVLTAILVSPLLNSVTFGTLAYVLPIVQLVTVIVLESLLLKRAGVGPWGSHGVLWRSWAITCAAFNLASLAAAILAGRVFLGVFYPGVA
jgi:ATP/ADP translocase